MIYIEQLHSEPYDLSLPQFKISGTVESRTQETLFFEKSRNPYGGWAPIIGWKLSPGSFELTFIDYTAYRPNAESWGYYRLRTDSVISLNPDIPIIWERSDYYPQDWTERTFEGETPPFRFNVIFEPVTDELGHRVELTNYKLVLRARQKILRRCYREGILMFALVVGDNMGHCPFCWDPAKGTRTTSQCPYCLGTGWAQPFTVPVPTFGVFTGPRARTVQESPLGAQSPKQASILLPAVPTLEPNRDYIYVPFKNKFYSVKSVDDGPIYGFPTQQLVMAVEEPSNSQLYALVRELMEFYRKHGIYPNPLL